MKEEWTIEQASKKEPFKVPEGYFESLTPRVMDRIAQLEKEKKPARILSIHRFTPLFYAAAMFIGILIFSGLWSTQNTQDAQEMAADESTYVDEMANYAMLDEFMIDDYLTDASAE